MTTFDAPDALDAATKKALIDLLYRMADDEIVLGHRDSEWTGHAPIIEEDIAFSSMAQDEMGHALAYYNLLTELGEPDADTMAFGRSASDYRCASLVCLPKGDWAFSLVRQYLFDAAEGVRLAALAASTFTPLANIARKLAGEEKYHLMHGRTWIARIGAATDESRRRMQTAVDEAYPHALGLFEPTSADEILAQSGICPREADLRAQWESSVAPVLADAELKVPEGVTPQYGGRTGVHPAALADLLESMQLVYNIDPSAKW
ncbi:MAG: phenylacetate-CoA oxygenase subunit PaaC [Planctomycetes bacterium]|nr:phenylacetate-CoA oxygenase subunit PaaC [Planctomycetota bacterium]